MVQCRIVSHPGSQEGLSRADCPTSVAEGAWMRRIPYRRVIGLLTYLYRTRLSLPANSAVQCQWQHPFKAPSCLMTLSQTALLSR